MEILANQSEQLILSAFDVAYYSKGISYTEAMRMSVFERDLLAEYISGKLKQEAEALSGKKSVPI